MATNMAHAAAKIECMESEVQGLTATDLRALHVLKHEVIAGIFRLYKDVGPVKADPVLKRFFSQLVEAVQTEIQGTGGGSGGVAGGDNTI